MVLNHVDFFIFFFTTPVYKLIQILKFPIQLRLTELQTLPADKKPRTLRHRSSGVSFAGAATSIIFVATKGLSRQTRACRDIHVFVTAKHAFGRNKGMLVATKLCLSLQAYFGRDKRRALSGQAHVCRDKSVLVATKIFCRDKHNFVATSIFLSRRKTFVATKMILEAASANDAGGSRKERALEDPP